MRLIRAIAAAAFVLAAHGVAHAQGWNQPPPPGTPPPLGWAPPPGARASEQVAASAHQLSDSARRLADVLSRRPVASTVYGDVIQLAQAAERFHREVEHGAGNRNVLADFELLRDQYERLRFSLYSDRGLNRDPSLRRPWYDVVVGVEDLALSLNAPPSRSGGALCEGPMRHRRDPWPYREPPRPGPPPPYR